HAGGRARPSLGQHGPSHRAHAALLTPLSRGTGRGGARPRARPNQPQHDRAASPGGARSGGSRGSPSHRAHRPASVDPAALLAFFGNFQDLYWVLDDAQQQQLLALPASAFDNDSATWAIVRAQTYWLRKDVAKARVYAD